MELLQLGNFLAQHIGLVKHFFAICCAHNKNLPFKEKT